METDFGQILLERRNRYDGCGIGGREICPGLWKETLLEAD